MPRKIRELLQDLTKAGFYEIQGDKGSHRKLAHPSYAGAVTISGNQADDAKAYQEKQVQQALEAIKS